MAEYDVLGMAMIIVAMWLAGAWINNGLVLIIAGFFTVVYAMNMKAK